MRREAICFAGWALSAISGASAFADCASDVKSAVEAQAQADFIAHKALSALVPQFDFDGSHVQSLDVPVADTSDLEHPFVTYKVSIDEVCRVEIQSRK